MIFINNLTRKMIKTFKSTQKQYNTINYSDQIIKSLVVTTYVKKKFNILFMMLLTIILRNILCCLLCVIFTYNLYVDFFLHSVISIVLILQSHIIYEVIKSKKTFFYKITKYAINNYTIDNYRRWKRNILLTLSAIGIVMLLFIELNSYLLIYYIFQNLFIYGIVDVIEHDKIGKLLKEMKDKPRNKQFAKLQILEDYYIINDAEQLNLIDETEIIHEKEKSIRDEFAEDIQSNTNSIHNNTDEINNNKTEDNSNDSDDDSSYNSHTSANSKNSPQIRQRKNKNSSENTITNRSLYELKKGDSNNLFDYD